MAEAYADKMARKTDAELRQYVTGREQYRDDAVLAALDELSRRGLSSADDATIRPELEASLQAQAAKDAEAHQAAEVAAAQEAEEERQEAGPVLYSPGTITLFSVLFSMLAGGALLAANLRTIGQSKTIPRLVLFVVLYLLVGSAILLWAVPKFGLSPWLTAFFDLPAIVAYNMWFWPRYIRTGTYQSRSWLVPFIICGVLKLGLAFIAAQYMAQVMGLKA